MCKKNLSFLLLAYLGHGGEGGCIGVQKHLLQPKGKGIGVSRKRNKDFCTADLFYLCAKLFILRHKVNNKRKLPLGISK